MGRLQRTHNSKEAWFLGAESMIAGICPSPHIHYSGISNRKLDMIYSGHLSGSKIIYD